MPTKKPTVASLQRKVERLEDQLSALRDLLIRDRLSEYEVIRRNADMRVRIEQAVEVLTGEME